MPPHLHCSLFHQLYRPHLFAHAGVKHAITAVDSPLLCHADNAKKKEPVLAIVITLFKVYFHLNTLQLCKNLINAVDRLQFDAFPASSRVTYMFYLGRLHIFDNDYVSPERNLPWTCLSC